MKESAQELQSKYYASTASQYDSLHVKHGSEHNIALHHLVGLIKYYKIHSILDIGAGTGRVAIFLKENVKNIEVTSIEPVEALRKKAYENGLSESEIMDGNIYNLDFSDRSFDLVCAFGVFHHLENPSRAIQEMMRISRKSLFISDSNNFGQGRKLTRNVKHLLRYMKLWEFLIYIKTRGKNYTITEGDGLAYSFSIYDLLKSLKPSFLIYLISTVPTKGNIFKTSSHAAVFATRKEFS